MNLKQNIAIIGAGVAGINAARHLAEHGHQVNIYEAADKIGGRAASLTDKTSGDMIDNGQHIMIGAYYEFLEMLRSFQADEHIIKQKSLITRFIDESGVYNFDTSRLPGKAGFLDGFLRFDMLNYKQKIQIVRFYLNILLNKNFDTALTVFELLRKWNQDTELIKLFWEPLIISALNTQLEEASAKIFVNVMKAGFFKSRSAAAIYIPQVAFSELFAKFAHPNINIHYKKRITEIAAQNCEVKHIAAGEEIIRADKYISCVPPYILNRLLEGEEHLGQFEYSPIISLYLWYDENIMKDDFYAVSGGNYDWIFNKSNIDLHKSSFAKGFYTLTKSAADEFMNLKNDELLLKAKEDIRRFLKFDKDPLHHRIIKEKFATIKSTPASDKFRPSCKTKYENLFIAGEWTDTGFPSTLEGAAISGKIAAQSLMKF